ncbi:gliding motility-associated peptidyl-prolyl isomerase [Wenyingzhuangia heitensis]|uniref:Peptidyl-prolyl cis-trans isomerase n=1 Tax=Wenyingzhuangia heitensis TaxID=1487859 RepID=A0ABX0UB05_9FLAO|nr:FKBP-type peptidyl-prolyl cis-trans isomerase [Wenyingzhuangia heitensis]NIJ45468.1 gliding motility-associated peptidyl-prolyl isomerase [Wenyingzhuangia heitensis]
MKHSWLFILGMLFVSCTQSKPRRAINKVKASKKVEYSILYNKKINSIQEKLIKDYIQKDSLLTYEYSPYGFAYAVVKSSTKPKKVIKESSVLTFSKSVFLLNNKEVYPEEILTVKLNTSNLIKGIIEGLKLMREDEEIKFIFSSFVAHGLNGDKNKIGSHTPIVVNIKLLKINN